jgi:hypothetical protein
MPKSRQLLLWLITAPLEMFVVVSPSQRRPIALSAD